MKNSNSFFKQNYLILVIILMFCVVPLSAQKGGAFGSKKKPTRGADGKVSRTTTKSNGNSSNSVNDSISQIFSNATKLLQRREPNSPVMYLYTQEEVHSLVKAKRCYVATEGKDESYTQRSRKIYASYWGDKENEWQTNGYQPQLDLQKVQSHYQYELSNLAKANSDRLIALQSDLTAMENASQKYRELFPNEASVKQASDNVMYLKKKLSDAMAANYGKNMTGDFHKNNVGKILFSEKPIIIGNENPSQFSKIITLDEHTDGVNKSLFFAYYDYQTHREKRIAKVKYSLLIKNGAPFCGEGKREIINTPAHDQAYFNENLLLDLSTYNTDNFSFVADNDKKVFAGCLGALLPGEYTLQMAFYRGSGTMPIKQSVKIMVTEGFGKFTQKIQDKIEEASINDVKFKPEVAASKKYLPFIKSGLTQKGIRGILKIVPISGWKDIEVTQKDALGRPYVTEKYSLLIFEYSFKAGDGKFYLKKGALRKPYKGNDNAKRMDFTTQINQVGRGPWQMSEKNAY